MQIRNAGRKEEVRNSLQTQLQRKNSVPDILSFNWLHIMAN